MAQRLSGDGVYGIYADADANLLNV